MVDLAKIKLLRGKLKLTQEQAAERAGLSSRQQWYHIESGRSTPSLPTLGKVAKALGVKPGDLLK